jgi:bifunctional non-homologous end joining protein LigD
VAGLDEYRRKRDSRHTPEPVPDADELPKGRDDVFVIQEHHARRLHWDVRLERDGVLVSFAVPKGLPPEPGPPRLAVHTEDHPLEYASFEGEIPAGEYGGGKVLIWDHGKYETLHWSPHKVEVALHGRQARGRYVFVQQHGTESERNWLVRRTDPPERDWEALPGFLPPMRARPGRLPPVEEDDDWAYEFAWQGLRVVARVQGGRVQLFDEAGADVTRRFPELRGIGEELGATEALLDGDIVVLDDGTPSPEGLDRRQKAGDTRQADRLKTRLPAVYLAFDLLHLDGRSCLDLPYLRRRALLTDLRLAGQNWQTPEHYVGDGGSVLRAGRVNGLAGVVAKRADGIYRPGKKSPDWTVVTGVRVQEVVIGGWREGDGDRSDTFGSLLLGVPHGDALRYVGNVGTGFDAEPLESLGARLRRLERKRRPFHSLPPGKERNVHWVRPEIVGEVVFRDWTAAGCLKSPRWRGLRANRKASEVELDG